MKRFGAKRRDVIGLEQLSKKTKGNIMKTIKKILGWVILAAVALFAVNFILSDIHHVVMFALIVGGGVFAFVKLTSAKAGPTTRRVKRFLAQKLSK